MSNRSRAQHQNRRKHPLCSTFASYSQSEKKGFGLGTLWHLPGAGAKSVYRLELVQADAQLPHLDAQIHKLRVTPNEARALEDIRQ